MLSAPLSHLPAHARYAHQAEYLQRRFIDEGLAREFASNAHYHPLNLLGTLQVAGGVPGARVGAPVWSQYSPSQFVHKADGMWSCVHLTAKGYSVLYAELLKRALPALRASARLGLSFLSCGPRGTEETRTRVGVPSEDEQGCWNSFFRNLAIVFVDGERLCTPGPASELAPGELF